MNLATALRFPLPGLHTFIGDMVSQVIDLILEELTLDWFELQVVLNEALKHNMQAMQVFFEKTIMSSK